MGGRGAGRGGGGRAAGGPGAAVAGALPSNATGAAVMDRLAGVADDVIKKRDGSYTAYHSFYYRTLAPSQDAMARSIQKAIPNARIRLTGEQYKPFRGGATVQQGSHVWVNFRIG